MSSTQLPPLDQREIEFLKKVIEGTPTEGNESRDYAETLLWKDEKEFQEVLDYWSSWFRVIHTAKLAKPIEPEFQRCWEQYYMSEVVRFISPHVAATNSVAFVQGFMVGTIGMGVVYGHKVTNSKSFFLLTDIRVSLRCPRS